MSTHMSTIHLQIIGIHSNEWIVYFSLRSYGILGTGLLIDANSFDIGSSLRVVVVSSVAQFVLLMGIRKRKQPEHVDAQLICNILLQNIPQADAEAVPERIQQSCFELEVPNE